MLCLYAVKSIVAAAYIWDSALGDASGGSCGASTLWAEQQSCREALGIQEGCCNVNCMETHCYGSASAEQLLYVHVAAKRVLRYLWKVRNVFNVRPVIQRPERAAVVAALSTWRRNTSFGGTSQLHLGRPFLHCTAPSPHCAPQAACVCVTLWPSAPLHQKSLRRAVLGKPLARQEALFWASVLMLCCKCILFKGCTNYKLVLGDEDKNIFSRLVSVNNLWCYLEAWHSFHVAGNVRAACEGLQQSWCRASSWSGWRIKQRRNFFDYQRWQSIYSWNSVPCSSGRNLSFPHYWGRKGVYYTKCMLQ